MTPIALRQEVIAIVRKVPASSARAAAEALMEGGIRLIEVTLNTEDALQILSDWRRRYEGQVRVGAGTVLDRGDAERAVAAGAEFLISPNLDEEVIAYGRERCVEVWPGVMTPSEIVRAWKAGATAVKVFPAGTLGPRYFREVRAPLDRIPLIAVGGVGLDNIREFLDAGATAVGVGSQLVDRRLIEEGKFEELASLARRFVTATGRDEEGCEKREM